jgi:hypothetical protein
MIRIFYIVIVIFVLFIIHYYLTINENTKNTDTPKVELFDWWGEDHISIEIFEEIFKDVNKQIKVYSVFGESEPVKTDDSLCIQYSGEKNYRDITKFDINFVPHEKEEKNVILFPHLFFHLYYVLKQTNTDLLSIPRKYDSSKTNKFCLFSVSNGGCEDRNKFFERLSEYKRVDSCGGFMNNMNGERCPGSHGDPIYYEFISNYKFMICFENVSKPNYLTEKLLNAYSSGTIPIYWGCSNIEDYVNTDAILYLRPNYTQHDVNMLIESIRYLDNNEEAYKEKYEKPLFNKKQIESYSIEGIRTKVNSLLKKSV